MNTYRFFWDTHKWVGIGIAAFLLLVAGTGFFLLLKKEFDWIQPPTQKGSAGTSDQFISVETAWAKCQAAGHPDFARLEQLDRVDVRPDKRVYKMLSTDNHSEMQIDAITGEVLSQDERVSDLLEDLHDGSWIGKPVHDYVMPLVALLVYFLVFSGLWLWLEPKVKRWRRRRRDRLQG